jgi:hypothetical protein
MRLGVDLSILNQKGTPAFYSDIFANRPAFGYAGRVFISTDTGAIYEDTGSAWVLIADAGAGTTGTLQQVTTNGNTTTQGLVVTSGNVAIGTATAGAPLDIHSTGTNAQFNGTGTNNAYVFFQNAGTSKWRLGNFYNAGANSFDIYDTTNATTRLSVRNTGEVLITGYNTISNTPTFASSGNYASNPSLNLTVPASSTFNSGASFAGMASSLLNTWQGNNTIASGAVMAGFIGVNRQSFNAAGYAITLTQGSAGIRAVAGMQVLQQTGGSFNGTVSHGASLLVQGVYPTTAANITYTNYYGLLINQLDEYGGVTFTNRWGIYQGGATDTNYFAANSLFGTTTDNGSKLQVQGAGTFSSSVTASSFIKSGGTSAQILAADGSNITAGTNITISGGTISASGGMSIGGLITGATAGSVLYAGAAGVLAQSNSNLYFDYTNNRLGLNTTSPATTLQVSGSTTAAAGVARSATFSPTLVAAANGDTLSAVYINPTFTNGAFTGVSNFALNTVGGAIFNGNAVIINPTSGLSYQIFRRNSTDYATIGVAAAAGDLITSSAANDYCFRANSGRLLWSANNGSSIQMALTTSGTLGIGTATIGSTLQVNGSAAIGYSASTAAPTNGLLVNGNIGVTVTSAAGVLQPLDVRRNGGNVYPTLGSNPAGANMFLSNTQGLFGMYLGVIGADGTGWIQQMRNDTATAYSLALNPSGGNVWIGSQTDVASAKLQVASTTQGFLPPVMTTTQKNAISSPAAGLIVFDTTLAKLCVYASGAWQTITSV